MKCYCRPGEQITIIKRTIRRGGAIIEGSDVLEQLRTPRTRTLDKIGAHPDNLNRKAQECGYNPVGWIHYPRRKVQKTRIAFHPCPRRGFPAAVAPKSGVPKDCSPRRWRLPDILPGFRGTMTRTGAPRRRNYVQQGFRHMFTSP